MATQSSRTERAQWVARYTYPPSVAVAFAVFILGAFLVSAYYVFGVHPAARRSELAPLLAGFLVPALIVYYLKRFEVQVDAEGLVRRGLLRTTRIKWTEVEDLICAATYTVVRARHRRTLRLLHPAPSGLAVALAGHWNLRAEIQAHLRDLLLRRWEREPRRIYPFPRIPRLVTGGFLLFPLLLSGLAWMQGIPAIQAAGLAGLFYAAEVPFYYRRYAESKRRLLLTPTGLALSLARGQVSLAWGEIGEITLREPTDILSYGAVVLHSRNGSRRITIPRGIGGCGELLYRIERNTGGRGLSPIGPLGAPGDIPREGEGA